MLDGSDQSAEYGQRRASKGARMPVEQATTLDGRAILRSLY
jgi:hypothetical protein